MLLTVLSSLWLTASAAARSGESGSSMVVPDERPHETDDAQTVVETDASDRKTRVFQWREALFWLLILLLIFVIAAIAIIRFSVRYKQYLLRSSRPPTPSEDVWTLHKLPRDDDLHLPPDDDDLGDDGDDAPR